MVEDDCRKELHDAYSKFRNDRISLEDYDKALNKFILKQTTKKTIDE